jgi:predicted Rossmann fold nucleotide-binding protein DprA/Smf involved in DNA uptake
VLGAVPGPANAPLSFGPHALLRAGAHLVETPQDILGALFGADAPDLAAGPRGVVATELRPLLDAIADGFALPEAFAAAGLGTEGGLAGLAALEMDGHLRRGPGGRFTIVG